MARRMSMGAKLDAAAQAHHDGEIAGKALAIAMPHAKYACSVHDQASELAQDLKLTGDAREEFIKGVAWGWTGKKYALPD